MKHMALAKETRKLKDFSTKFGRLPNVHSPDVKAVVCIDDGGYVDLVLGKVYQVKSDATARSVGMLRIVDESMEDYLYPASFFQAIHARAGLFKLISKSRQTRRKPRKSMHGKTTMKERLG
jgi:hypothetical protein